MKDIFKDKLKQATKFLDVELNPDDPKLKEQMTLGDNWDNPKELIKAMDMHPSWFARWSTILRNLKADKMKIKAFFDVWSAEKRKKVRRNIVKRRLNKGLTKKQANDITISMISDEFDSSYNYDGKYSKIFIKRKTPLDDINEKIDKVQIIVDALKMRKEFLITMAYMVRSMMDNKLEVRKRK